MSYLNDPRVLFSIGVAFILFGVTTLLLTVRQSRKVATPLSSGEIPPGYWVNRPVRTNLVTALLGLVLATYLALV